MGDVIRISRSHPRLPAAMRHSGVQFPSRIALSSPERKILRKRKPVPPSRWCESHRHITMSRLKGLWKNSVTPYLAGIMDASFFQSVSTVILCKAVQVGGTEAILNCIGYLIDRDPGPVLLVYPDELTGKENSQDRVQPMILASPRLRSYLTRSDDDATVLRINLQHMPIYIGWARSAARLGNKPIRYVVFDEVDKYPDTAGKRESDPISLGKARTTTFRHNRKIWKLSTPTTEDGNIWKALTTEAQVIFDFWVTCPLCGHHHRMEFSGIQWAHKSEPGEDGKCHSEDPETIEADKLAWYECPGCSAKWNDYDRDLAVRAGTWRARPEDGSDPDPEGPPPDLFAYLNAYRPGKIGFHLPSWISPFVSFGEIAAAYLRGLRDLNKFKDFCNNYEAIPWRLTLISKSDNEILSSRTDLPPQSVPEAAVALTCGIDVQKNGFWFAVRAWAPDLTSWLIHYGYLATWEDVEKLLFGTSYPSAGAGGRPMRIFRACVDTGGGRKYENMTMTEETYFWILKNMRRGGCSLWGTKGSSSPLPGMLSVGSGILSTPAGKKLPGVLRILSVDTEKAKDQFHYRIKLASSEETRSLPGAAFLHSATGTDYSAQILAEQKEADDKGREMWVNKHHRPNHLLDAECLAAVCVEMEYPGGGLRILANTRKQASQQTGCKVISRGVEL